MTRLIFPFLFLSVVLSGQVSYETLVKRSRELINQNVFFFEHTTIDGLKIDSNYFKGKVTILSFFAFGCGPCYTELGLLNEISKTYSKDKYQILFLGDATEKDLRDLRAYNSKRNRKLKRKLGVDTLAFDIIADCPENPVRFIARSCKGSSEIFRVFAFPTTFFINPEGIIKEICMGFAMPRNKEFDDYFYSKLKEAEK